MDDHQRKLYSFLYNKIKDLKNPKILEFGVREGKSTKMFIDLVEKNNGYVVSVDVDDYSNLFNSERWKFIKSRDDNFELIKKEINYDLDVILLDSLHEADHVKNIITNYYDLLKEGGYFFIDDISWLPYLKNKNRDSFYSEINNKETFEIIIDLYNSNYENFDLEFSFISSGFACMQKKKKLSLIPTKKYNYRSFSLKNFVRKLKKKIKI
tara:strand:+ start:865 stop:1494 length:630 start_codon:yes stop_codon:yes gene_type:complete